MKKVDTGYTVVGAEDTDHATMQMCNNYAMQYSIASYLLISMLLGMSRSVVLETEAQLLLMCALGLALLTYLMVYVRAYFEYVTNLVTKTIETDELQMLVSTQRDDHTAMMKSIFLFTQIIGTAVAFVFFGIAFHVLFVLSDFQGAVLWIVFMLVCLYLCIHASEVVCICASAFSLSCCAGIDKFQWPRVYYLYSLFVTLIVSITVLGASATDSRVGRDLRRLESVQYMAMANADPNQMCGSGVQKNTLLQQMASFQTDKGFDDDSILRENNPVNFKVFHWTRWWEFGLSMDSLQPPSLYLCSLGMEQHFGTCSAEYKLPAKPFESLFQVIADAVKLS
jgi:hypothetical protein